MINVNRILIMCLLLCAACKPQELKIIGTMGRRVRVSTADGFVYTELGKANEKILTSEALMYSWYDKGVINSSQGAYSGKLLDGQYIAYYAKNKQLKEKGEYAEGLKTGKWLVWKPDGYLLESQQWNKGLKNGKTIRYDSLGNEKEKIRYKNGLPVEKKKKISLANRFKHFTQMFKRKKSQ